MPSPYLRVFGSDSLLRSCTSRSSMIATLLALLTAPLFFLLGIRRKPVSYPGDARKKKCTKKARWAERETSIAPGWKFAVDQESYDVSHRTSKYEMTGDPCGRQIWYKDEGSEDSTEDMPTFCAARNPNAGDQLERRIMLSKWKGAVPDEDWKPTNAKDAARKGLAFYQMLQCEDGHWAGDYGGPLFLMPGLIIVLYVTKVDLPQYKKDAMVEYMLNHQQIDGGWGTHIEQASTMFGTVLNYVALRLLGVSAEEPNMVAAREFIHQRGGALYTSSWAKFYLAVLGLYDWTGINAVPCELWYLPRWFPFHPGKLWCHCRMVYLPMGYVYCKRFQADAANDPILSSLRKELYLQSFDTINWDAHRYSVHDDDEYSALSWVARIAFNVMAIYERFFVVTSLRELGLKFVIDYIREEDKQTNFVDIGPVNKVLNMLSVYIHHNGDTSVEEFQRHLPRIEDYLWVAEDGMKMQGYNGSQCWDTSFAVQAIVESGLATEFKDCSKKVYEFLDRTQIKTDEEHNTFWFRQISKGGWPFSTPAHGWPISDCTSEGLKGVLALHRLPWVHEELNTLSAERLYDAVNVILDLHNADGGWATYENNRGYGWYEELNPSEAFGDIMIDYSYVECTSACITALQAFRNDYPDHRAREIKSAIQAGRSFMKSIQRPDGSWYGSWGVCFTYGTWFGIEGLVSAGEPLDSSVIRKAMDFLLSKQNANGGWGESYLACVDKAYPVDGAGVLGEDESGVVQTAWALLGLMAGKCPNRAAIDRGIRYLMRKQLPSGDWAQEGITGVFNRNCGITYTAYRNVFPIWALGRYAQQYE